MSQIRSTRLACWMSCRGSKGRFAKPMTCHVIDPPKFPKEKWCPRETVRLTCARPRAPLAARESKREYNHAFVHRSHRPAGVGFCPCARHHPLECGHPVRPTRGTIPGYHCLRADQHRAGVVHPIRWGGGPAEPVTSHMRQAHCPRRPAGCLSAPPDAQGHDADPQRPLHHDPTPRGRTHIRILVVLFRPIIADH